MFSSSATADCRYNPGNHRSTIDRPSTDETFSATYSRQSELLLLVGQSAPVKLFWSIKYGRPFRLFWFSYEPLPVFQFSTFRLFIALNRSFVSEYEQVKRQGCDINFYSKKWHFYESFLKKRFVKFWIINIDILKRIDRERNICNIKLLIISIIWIINLSNYNWSLKKSKFVRLTISISENE